MSEEENGMSESGCEGGEWSERRVIGAEQQSERMYENVGVWVEMGRVG